MSTKKREPNSLKSLIIWKIANALSGHSRPLDPRPDPGPYEPYRPHVASTSQSSNLGINLGWKRPPRVRCLTPPPSDQQSDRFPILDEQSQSSFFILPQEARLKIYEEILGKTVIHIVGRSGRIGHASCKSNGTIDDCKEKGCRGLKMPNGLHTPSGIGIPSIVPVLQICRRIYVEATDAVYSSNTYDFDSMESLILFSAAILPQRFDSITSIQLDFRFNISLYFSEMTASNDLPRWERVWRIIASMPNLQNIKMRISWPRELYASGERKLLDPLWLIDNKQTFDVSLPPLKGNEVAVTDDWPFRVIRRKARSV